MTESPDPSPIEGYVFGRFRLDLATHELLAEGTAVPLTPKAFSTLVVLLERRGRVVPKDELMKAVWPDSFVSDESLAQNIWGIRRALGDDTSRPTFIATIPRRGYRFVAPVTELRAGNPGVAGDSAPDAPLVAATTPEEVPRPAPQDVPSLHWARHVAVTVAIAAVAVIGTYMVTRSSGTSAPDPVIRFQQPSPVDGTFASGGLLSPNGRFLAFLAQDQTSGSTELWVRPIDGVPRRLQGTTGAAGAFWAPASDAIGFFSDGKVKRVDLGGDSVQAIADVSANASGGSWHRNGQVLVGGGRSGILSVPVGGGTPKAVTTVDREAGEWSHRFPQFLPDGRHFLFGIVSLPPERSGTYVGSIDGSVRRRLLDASHTAVTYAAPGYLVFVRDGDLLAQPFDTASLELAGEATVIETDVTLSSLTSDTGISASDNGFLSFGGGRSTHLTWFSRTGTRLDTIDSPTRLHNPMLLRGERQLLATSAGETRAGIWLVDLEGGASNWIVPDGALPVPSPDGTQIAFSSARRTGVGDLYLRNASGEEADTVLLQSDQSKGMQDWSPDGRYLLYTSTSPQTATDLWLLPLEGERTPRPYLQTTFEEVQARLSPDSQWVAYVTNESGRREVVVQSFPEPGIKRTVSARGGSQPVWRTDGAELFYLAPDQMLMSVTVTAGRPMTFGTPRPLFRAPVLANRDTRRAQYAVAGDGQRFLVDAFNQDAQEPVSILFNWPRLLTRNLQ